MEQIVRCEYCVDALVTIRPPDSMIVPVMLIIMTKRSDNTYRYDLYDNDDDACSDNKITKRR